MKRFLPFAFLLTLAACTSEPYAPTQEPSVMWMPIYEAAPAQTYAYPEPATVWQDPPPLISDTDIDLFIDYLNSVDDGTSAPLSEYAPPPAAPSTPDAFNRVGVYTNRPR